MPRKEIFLFVLAYMFVSTYFVGHFRSEGGVTISPVKKLLTFHREVTSQNTGIVINKNDPESIEIGWYYQTKRGIPNENIVHVSLPLKNQLTAEEFGALSQEVNAALPKTVQIIAVAWTNPSRVNCNGITSAISLGYNDMACVDPRNVPDALPYYNSLSLAPYTDFGFRPSMMLAGKSVSSVKKLIERGVASDNSQPFGSAYIMKTSDQIRSMRANNYSKSMLGHAISQQVHVKLLSAQPESATSTKASSENYISNTTDALFYFQGLTKVPNISSNKFPNGAVADHLTSFGGMLTDTSQMSILEFIEAGVTGSYGTVSEPYALKKKFPDPQIVITHYTQGETLIESYWKSVAFPAQGVFVGEPLASPWAE